MHPPVAEQHVPDGPVQKYRHRYNGAEVVTLDHQRAELVNDGALRCGIRCNQQVWDRHTIQQGVSECGSERLSV